MKRILLSLLLAAAPAGAQTVELSTEQQKTLYALGLSIARDIAVFRIQPDELESVLLGLRDGATGKRAKVELEPYREKLYFLMKARRDAPYKEFLAKTAAEPGVQSFPSGLLFHETRKGEGAQPTENDSVKVHYRGTLMDGTGFDNSYDRGQPSQFPLRGVIRCWQEGIPKLRVGGAGKLICPASIAYGERGSPPAIPPGAALVFEVELLEILKP